MLRHYFVKQVQVCTTVSYQNSGKSPKAGAYLLFREARINYVDDAIDRERRLSNVGRNLDPTQPGSR